MTVCQPLFKNNLFKSSYVHYVYRKNYSRLARNEQVYIKIKKGAYRLKQAAMLAYINLINNLKKDGYSLIPHTDKYWHHEKYPMMFCLCANDFRVKYFEKRDLNHLITLLLKNYKISTDYSGTNYCGLTIEWIYADGYEDVSVPNYIQKH